MWSILASDLLMKVNEDVLERKQSEGAAQPGHERSHMRTRSIVVVVEHDRSQSKPKRSTNHPTTHPLQTWVHYSILDGDMTRPATAERHRDSIDLVDITFLRLDNYPLNTGLTCLPPHIFYDRR